MFVIFARVRRATFIAEISVGLAVSLRIHFAQMATGPGVIWPSLGCVKHEAVIDPTVDQASLHAS